MTLEAPPARHGVSRFHFQMGDGGPFEMGGGSCCFLSDDALFGSPSLGRPLKTLFGGGQAYFF